jgi:hypothetical protein
MPDKGKGKAIPPRPDSAPPLLSSLPSPPQLPSPKVAQALPSNAQGITPHQASAPMAADGRILRAPLAQTPSPRSQSLAPTSPNPIVRPTFLYQKDAQYFLSIYSRNSALVKRVHNIGTAFDTVTTARVQYLELLDSAKAAVLHLARSLPGDATPRNIAKKLQAIVPDRSYEDPHFHDLPASRPPMAAAHTTAPTGALIPTPQGQGEPLRMARSHLPTSPMPSTQTGRQAPPTRHRKPYLPRCQHPDCTQSGQLDHCLSDCPQYHCQYCDTSAPSHFAKYCTRNPRLGPSQGQVPSGRLGL